MVMMPRKPRIDLAGYFYHVIQRGVERKPIFRDDTDRDRFLELLGDGVSRFRKKTGRILKFDLPYSCKGSEPSEVMKLLSVRGFRKRLRAYADDESVGALPWGGGWEASGLRSCCSTTGTSAGLGSASGGNGSSSTSRRRSFSISSRCSGFGV